MYKKNKVSVGIVAYNEEASIAKVVRDFKNNEFVDEVIVIDNNSTDKTNELAGKSGANVVKEPKQGYGNACKRALIECSKKGDIIILTEGDASFEARDIEKLLSYIDDVDMVMGTRTTRELIGKGAKMGWFLLWGNFFIAKLLQLRFWGRVRLTDVGCTYRAIRKSALKKIVNKLTVGKSHFLPEMTVLILKSRLRLIEIPLNYKERIGESKITSDTWKSFKLGLRMIWTIFTR